MDVGHPIHLMPPIHLCQNLFGHFLVETMPGKSVVQKMDPTKIMRIFTLPKLTVGGGFKYFRNFHPYIWEMIQFDWYLWYGVKPPTRNLTWQWKKESTFEDGISYYNMLTFQQVIRSFSWGVFLWKSVRMGMFLPKKYPNWISRRRGKPPTVTWLCPCKHVPFGTRWKKQRDPVLESWKKRARFTTQ